MKAHAQFVLLSDGQLVEGADRIVTGTWVVRGEEVFIKVSENLKGVALASGEIQTEKGGDGWSPDFFSPGAQGIFFLRHMRDGKAVPYNPACFMPLAKLPYIKSLVDMMKDPTLYIDLNKYPENLDRIYLLGSMFSTFKATCKEFPNLENWVLNAPYYQYVPWNDISLIVVQGKLDNDDKMVLTLTASNPSGALAAMVLRSVGGIVEVSKANQVHGTFTLTIDTRWPEKVGALKIKAAADYLIDRLDSKDPEIVTTAIIALAKMRYLSARRKIRGLTTHEDSNVRLLARRCLIWAGEESPILLKAIESSMSRSSNSGKQTRLLEAIDLIYSDPPDYNGALAILEANIREFPNAPKADYNYSWAMYCYTKIEEYEKAYGCYEKLRRSYNGPLETDGVHRDRDTMHCAVRIILFDSGDPKAKAIADRMLALDSEVSEQKSRSLLPEKSNKP